MHRSPFTRPLARTFARPFLLLLTATSVLGAAACAGDEILAPIDGTRCTTGTLREDRPVEGAVTSKSCVLWSHWEYEFVPTESWTLNMKANTAYIIRLSPTEITPGVVPWRGNLTVYTRNAYGDVGLESESNYAFGPNGRGREIAITTDVARSVSIRAESWSIADTGAYSVEVVSCPLHRLTLDSLQTGLSSTGGCLAKGMHGTGASSRVTFATFDAPQPGRFDVTFARTAGAGSLRGTLAGPGLDFANTLSQGYRAQSGTVTTTYTYSPSFELPGRYTLAVSVHADSGATFRARAAVGAIPSVHAVTPSR